jgi:hypothetical protein
MQIVMIMDCIYSFDAWVSTRDKMQFLEMSTLDTGRKMVLLQSAKLVVF